MAPKSTLFKSIQSNVMYYSNTYSLLKGKLEGYTSNLSQQLPGRGCKERRKEDEIGENKRGFNFISNVRVKYKVLRCSFRIQCDTDDIRGSFILNAHLKQK